MIAKCPCDHCGENIEFDESNSGQAVTCPHCGVETMLCVPKNKNQPPSPAVQTPNKPTLTFKRDWLALVFQSTTAIAVIVCAVLIYKTTHQPDSLPRWKYAAFEWNNARFDRELHPNQILETEVEFTTGRMISQYVDKWDKQTVLNVDDLLNVIGRYG
jgi:hypothetical protein